MTQDEKKIIEDTSLKCSHLECDGTVKVFTYVLTESFIDHKVMCGSVEVQSTGDAIPLHYWIELPDGYTIDYKAQMWLDDNAPNGIFKHSAFPDYIYEGRVVGMKVSKIIFDILTNKF